MDNKDKKGGLKDFIDVATQAMKGDNLTIYTPGGLCGKAPLKLTKDGKVTEDNDGKLFVACIGDDGMTYYYMFKEEGVENPQEEAMDPLMDFITRNRLSDDQTRNVDISDDETFVLVEYPLEQTKEEMVAQNPLYCARFLVFGKDTVTKYLVREVGVDNPDNMCVAALMKFFAEHFAQHKIFVGQSAEIKDYKPNTYCGYSKLSKGKSISENGIKVAIPEKTPPGFYKENICGKKGINVGSKQLVKEDHLHIKLTRHIPSEKKMPETEIIQSDICVAIGPLINFGNERVKRQLATYFAAEKKMKEHRRTRTAVCIFCSVLITSALVFALCILSYLNCINF